MDKIRDWDVLTDGEAPLVSFARKGFKPTKAIFIENENGTFYGLSDGKLNLAIKRLTKSQAKQDADAASDAAGRALNETAEAKRVSVEVFAAKVNAAQSNDAEWAKLTADEKVERTRIVQLGILGLQTNNPDLVAKANDALPALAAAPDAPADLGPALEVKP